MPIITFIQPSGEQFDVLADEGDSLMRAAIVNDVPGIEADCGGSLACATCHVYVDKHWFDRLPPMGDAENEMLEMTACERQPNSRLSCQLRISSNLDGIVVQLPERQS